MRNRKTPMPFLEIMHAYFGGERGGFAWGLAIPLIVFGLFAIGVGAAVGLRTAGQVAAIESGIQSDPGVMLADSGSTEAPSRP